MVLLDLRDGYVIQMMPFSVKAFLPRHAQAPFKRPRPGKRYAFVTMKIMESASSVLNPLFRETPCVGRGCFFPFPQGIPVGRSRTI